MTRKLTHENSIPAGIPGYLKQAGYVDVDHRIHATCAGVDESNKAEFAAMAQRIAKVFFKQGLSGILSLGGVDGMRTQEEADKLLAEADEELQGDAIFHIPLLRSWGRKHLETA